MTPFKMRMDEMTVLGYSPNSFHVKDAIAVAQPLFHKYKNFDKNICNSQQSNNRNSLESIRQPGLDIQ